MAELKSTLVSGSLAAKKIYQNGTPLDEKFATTIALSGSTLQLKNAGGVVISSATIPTGEMSSSVSGGTVTTTVTKGGWFAKNTTSSKTVASGTITNNTSGGTSSGTIALGAQIKIGKGYYAKDLYYQAASASSGTAASGFSLSITDKGTTNITVGTKDGSYYPLTASLTGTFSASTAGYFSTGSATDSSVTVGRMAAAAFDVSGNKVYCKTAGYSPAGSANSPVATIATATPAFDGGTASVTDSSTSATASGLTISDTDTDPGSGIYISTSGSARATRTAVLYNGAVAGYVSVADNTTASSSHTSGVTTLTGNKYYVTAVTVPATKTLSTVTLAAGLSNNARTYLSTLTVNSYTTVSNITLSGIITTITASGGYISTINLNNTSSYVGNLYGTGYATVGSGKTLAKLNVTGTIRSVLSSGTITTLGGSVKVGTYSSTGTITTMSGTKTITTHSGTTTISSNTGTLNIAANTKTVKYVKWNLSHDAAGNLSFTYVG